MDKTWTSLFTEWDVPPAVTCALVLVTVVYIRGWFRIRRTRAALFPAWRLACFLGGMSSLFIAVASPLDTFSESLLFMHMAQHYVLMSVAPPLIVLGAPVVPLLRGLPHWSIRWILAPIFRIRTLSRLTHWLVHPGVALVAMNLAYIGWHVPAAYEFALSSEGWHNLEHFCFFATSVMFWWPVIQPWPGRAGSLRWGLIPYLLFSDIVNTALSAFLCFSGRLLYPSYGAIARPFGLNAQNDQVAAGAFMWVFGSLVFLIPAVAITAHLLSPLAQEPRGIRQWGSSQA
jgi:cytochrome c oxidase assembly factor CtaG